MLAEKHPEIQDAVLTVKKLSWREERRQIKEQLSLWAVDERYRKEAARAEGLAEGHAAGLAEGQASGYDRGRQESYREKLEMARKMKVLGDPREKIALVTGLSREDLGNLFGGPR